MMVVMMVMVESRWIDDMKDTLSSSHSLTLSHTRVDYDDDNDEVREIGDVTVSATLRRR